MYNDNSLTYISRLSPANVSAIDDLKYFGPWYNTTPERYPQKPGNYKFLGIAEEERSIPYKEFSYTVNSIGFRGNLPTENDVIGFFGCSFTYGEGVDDPDTFATIVSNHLNIPKLNLGMIGHSAQQAAQIFHGAAKLWKMKYAVITLPSPERFHYITKDNQHWPVFPNKDHNTKEHENVRKCVYKYFSYEHLLHTLKDTIVTIDLISKVYNINVIWGSWNGITNRVIDVSVKTNSLFFDYYPLDGGPLEGDWIGRDNMHPGIAQHALYAEKVINKITKEEIHE